MGCAECLYFETCQPFDQMTMEDKNELCDGYIDNTCDPIVQRFEAGYWYEMSYYRYVESVLDTQEEEDIDDLPLDVWG
jgi:hypothetical protein